jgi:hypothetical protein
MADSDEGLGLSVLVYALAMVCGLAVVVLPVYWANSARVYDNPGVTALRSPGGPTRSHRAEFPLAKLQSPQIVSAAMLAELNADSKKAKPVRHASRPSHRSYAQAQPQPEPVERRESRRPFFFSLF